MDEKIKMDETIKMEETSKMDETNKMDEASKTSEIDYSTAENCEAGGDVKMTERQPVARRRSYEAAFKLGVIEYAEKNSNRAAAKHHKVDQKRVREWRKQKDKLQSLPSDKARLSGGGRKPKYPKEEEILVTWLKLKQSQKVRLSRSMIQRMALQMCIGDEEFIASKGWLEKFLKRHNIKTNSFDSHH